MPTPTPQQGAQSWKEGLQKAAQRIAQGVDNVTVSPTELAAANLDTAAANYQEAVTSGRMARALRNVSLADWKDAFKTKGIPRIASGAAAAMPKMEAFNSKWYPIMEAASQQAKRIKKGTIEDSLARVRVIMEAGKKFAGKSY